MRPWLRSVSAPSSPPGPGTARSSWCRSTRIEAWGAKADHPVSGTIGGCRIRTRLVPVGRGWALTLAPKRLTGMGIAIGDEVSVELAPEGPQRGDLR